MDLIIYIVSLISATAMVILPLVKDVIKREQNVIAQKKKSRIIKKTNAENKNILKKLTWSGRWLFFAAVITIGFSIWAKIRDDKQRQIIEIKKIATEESLRNEIKKLRYTIDTLSDDPSERVSEGFSLFSILQVGDILDRRRKFIFDCGESASLNRLSLYLDYDNSLVFAIIDNSGNTYSIKAVPNFISFKPNATYFLHCGIGYSNDFSFIRIFLDDRLVGVQTFDNRISGEKIDWINARIGSDLEGRYEGKFSLSSVIAYKKAFSRKDIIDIMNTLTQ